MLCCAHGREPTRLYVNAVEKEDAQFRCCSQACQLIVLYSMIGDLKYLLSYLPTSNLIFDATSQAAKQLNLSSLSGLTRSEFNKLEINVYQASTRQDCHLDTP